jgi:hypothetical protein
MQNLAGRLLHFIAMRICPLCNARVTFARAKTYWAVAIGLKSQGSEVRVETKCCHGLLTMEQAKVLRQFSAPFGRKMGAARKTFGAGPGRDRVPRPCPFCGEQFGGREWRKHKPRCPKKPSRSAE